MRNQIEKASGSNASQNIKPIKADGSNGLSTPNFSEIEQDLQGKLLNHFKQHKKVHRLFKCEGCGNHRTLRKMSNCLILCRECVSGLNEKGVRAKSNFINRTVNQFQKKLQAGVL